VVTWIVVGVIVLAVLVLVGAAMALGGRARPLLLALRRLSIRAEQAQGLQRRVEALQTTAQQVQAAVEASAASRERPLR
jgi:hypothetical protein